MPVFNGEAHLRRCLDSLVAAVRDYSVELIVVDDGSSDASQAIAHEFSQQHAWIRYFRQKNRGASAARNVGLEMAMGDYVGFVDCDDCLAPSYVLTLLNASAGQQDIIVFGYERKLLNGSSSIHSPLPKQHLDEGAQLLACVNQDRELFWFSCTKLFRANSISGIRFDEAIRLGEDTIFNLQAVSRARSIVRIPDVLYYYYETPGSLSSAQYKPRLLESMDRHFKARLEVHGDGDGQLNRQIRSDMADYYLGHIVPWLISNVMRMEESAQLSELSRIRESRLVTQCFAWDEKIKVGRGLAPILLMFKFRMLRPLRALWNAIQFQRRCMSASAALVSADGNTSGGKRQ